MIKRLIIVTLFTLMIHNVCYAGWFDLLQDTVDVISSPNNSYRNSYNNATSANPRVIELFAGLKSDSSIIDVVNTFRKFDTVTNIKLGPRKGEHINLKDISNTDDKIYDTMVNLLSTSNFEQVDLYSDKVNMPKRELSIIIEKIYKDGIPYGIIVTLKPCAGYYYLYPTKVYKDKNGTVYPYIITNIFVSSYYDKDTESIIREKYGRAHLEHEYNNEDYYNAINEKYQKLLNKIHVEENKKLDSGIQF